MPVVPEERTIKTISSGLLTGVYLNSATSRVSWPFMISSKESYPFNLSIVTTFTYVFSSFAASVKFLAEIDNAKTIAGDVNERKCFAESENNINELPTLGYNWENCMNNKLFYIKISYIIINIRIFNVS